MILWDGGVKRRYFLQRMLSKRYAFVTNACHIGRARLGYEHIKIKHTNTTEFMYYILKPLQTFV